MTPDDCAQALEPDGALAQSLPGYAPRPAQARMAVAVASAMQGGERLVVEAGTGTGKTYAYLVPALLSGLRVVVSTGTRNLQDQLCHRDLPVLMRTLGVPVRVSLLKGRANYLCRYRFRQALDGATPAEAGRLLAVREWLARTDSGDIAELGWTDSAEPLLPRVTSTADNCLGGRCPDYEKCFVVRARRAAAGAEIVVVNHHLLFADFLLKREGFGELLPAADAVIVDEAHQLPELATRCFGQRLSTRQLMDLARDVHREAAALGDVPDLRDAADAVMRAGADLERPFALLPGRATLAAYLQHASAGPALAGAETVLEELAAALDACAERGEGVAACRDRARALLQGLAWIRDSADDEDGVRWVEPLGRGGSFHRTPVEVAGPFQQALAGQPGAWVFTSATLSAGADFSHFCGQLGLDEAATLALDSPFDYGRQARLFLPGGLPQPNDPAHADAVIDTVLPLLEASGGGAFLLCTSHRAVRRSAQRLREAGVAPLFVQGEDDRAALLQAFAEAGNGVLVGAASFWEGVDVRGPALRLVVIDRLPFAAPGDPVFDARLDAIRRRGGQPFTEYQLPQAIIGLRQGVGRLIRDAQDRGLLVIADPRLRTRGYGRRVLASLPALPLCRDLEEATAWLQQIRAAA